jgi:hypothetical protein
MELVLTAADIAKLSPSTRGEIVQFLVGSGTAETEVRSTTGTDEEPAEFTFLLTKKFMANVSDLTRDLLRLFAENGGRASLSQLTAKSGYKDWRKLRGFFAGVTKRARNILRDEEAYLLFWDDTTEKHDENDELLDGEYYMSKTTTESMRKFFGI